MHIYLGLHLDGQRGWHPRHQLGHPTLGPLGFLSVLETQLGLLREQPCPSERIVQYRDCLKRCDDESRFYHRSFATDELGSAATLLSWRDLWHLHGWQGKLDQATSARLHDMGDVEKFTQGYLAPSLGERLALVLQGMQGRRPSIEAIILVDPLASFPYRWRAVLNQLPVQDAAALVAHGEGFLGELQNLLIQINAGETTNPLAWRDDGSLTVVRAETRFLSGRWWVNTMAETKIDTLLVAEGEADAVFLDDLLAVNHQAREGFREASAFRPTLQVLPLALELIWQPLNYYALLQFLTHSVCPVPGFARYKLAETIADRPGMGGIAWRETLAQITAHYGDKATEVSERIQRWIENPRYPQNTGAPITALLERVTYLSAFFRQRLAESDPAHRIAFNAGYQQTCACAEALQQLLKQGVETLRPSALQKLLAQITSRGSENSRWVTEKGACAAVTKPGAVIEGFDRSIWWQMSMPVLPARYPWSKSELRQLAETGVRLPDQAEELAQAARHWLKPILAARKQCILVLPPEGRELHPLWLMIKAWAENIPVHELESTLTEAGKNTVELAHVPLPVKRRWWAMPAGALLMRQGRDSYSSLSLLLFNPYHWVLKYPAALKTAPILAVGQDFRLLGNLAHRLLERFFQESEALRLDDTAFAAWFGVAFSVLFDRLIAEEGATLLMPGRRSDLEKFRMQLRSALVQLRHQCTRAGVTQVKAEMELEGEFAGGALGGYADLVLTRADGHQAVLDMKWSGSQFADLLKENRHLQLAIYAELLRQHTGVWPQVGYYVLDRGQLLATDSHFFPEARLIKKSTEENTAQLWLRFIETWKWRRGQMAAGQIEVALEEIEETEASAFPNDGLVRQILTPNYNDYRALAGWKD